MFFNQTQIYIKKSKVKRQKAKDFFFSYGVMELCRDVSTIPMKINNISLKRLF